MQKILTVFALFVLSLILYIDRVCISSAKGAIATDLGLSDNQMGVVFSIFALGYALCQVPAGWLADRYGPRRLLTYAVAGWSIMTALTGAAGGFGSMLLIRLLFGMGEAGAFPGAARVLYQRLEPSERGFANGVLMSGARVGAALAYFALPLLLEYINWRTSFVLLGAVGVVWAVLWYAWFRDRPQAAAATPVVAAAPAMPFSRQLRTRPMLLSMAQYFASNFTFFLALSWMLPHLQQRFSLTTAQAGTYAMVPLLVAVGAQWGSGYAVDLLHRRGIHRWSRRLPAMIGFALAVLGLIYAIHATTPATVVAGFTLAVFGTDLTISPSWTYCVDFGRERSGAISGAMNMVGNLGSVLSASAFPFLLGLTGSASAYFWVAAALNLGGFFCWWGMTPVAQATADEVIADAAVATASLGDVK